MSGHDLKSLQVRQSKLDAELRQLRNEIGRLSKKENELKLSMVTVRKQIDRITSTQPTISEHALLRYVERVLEIDLKELREKILSPKVVDIIKTVGSGRVPIDERFEVIVKNNVVVTIHDREWNKGA